MIFVCLFLFYNTFHNMIIKLAHIHLVQDAGLILRVLQQATQLY